MGRKRGRHIVRIVGDVSFFNGRMFTVFYKTSKCKYARPLCTYIAARDELEAYQLFTRRTKGADQ